MAHLFVTEVLKVDLSQNCLQVKRLKSFINFALIHQIYQKQHTMGWLCSETPERCSQSGNRVHGSKILP